MTETPTGSRPGFTPPPVLTRRSGPRHGRWMAAFLPPFVAGRTLTPHRTHIAADAAAYTDPAPFEFEEVTLDDVALDDVAFDDVAFDDVAFGGPDAGDREIDDVVVDDVALGEPEFWEPDAWPTAEWTAEDTSVPQPASEAAAFEAWASPGAAAAADQTAEEPGADEAPHAPAEAPHALDGAPHAPDEEPDAPDDVARLVAQRLDELAGQVRSRGLAALGNPQDPDALSRLIAAVIAGYIGRSD